jgi:NAD+ synthase (glutamine-hydrolysing)
MRIALAQINSIIGDFEGNLANMLRAVEQARVGGADLICFPELAVCGYPPQDFLEFPDFIRRCQASVDALCTVSADIAIVVGAPVLNPVVEGKDLFNAALFLAEGAVRHVHHKALLPTYDIFDEYRYFEPASSFGVVEWRGVRIALTVCEDIWNVGNENPLYTICPLDEMMPLSPDLIINLSASPFSWDQARARKEVLRANTRRYGLPMFYVNQVGAQTELIFDGGSLVMTPDGQVYEELPYFETSLRIFDLAPVSACSRGQGEQQADRIALIHDALVLGLRDYFGKLGLRQAILGLSGGIDSAVTAALAAAALGSESVTGLLLPSRYSSDHSVADARRLAENLGIRHHILPIEPGYRALLDMVEPFFENRPFDVTEENIQARIRGLSLMAFSNKLGLILLNTTNKSEMAVGYGTLYGDLCGGLSVIGDVYKTEVYELAAYINRNREIIPANTIRKPPSAELRPDQKDSDSLPEYAELDAVLQGYIEERLGPRELIARGHEEALVRRVLRLVNTNEFKRHQTAPVLRVSPKAFGMGRRIPIVARYLG